MNIRFSGFGGQGIILSGVIYGQAAVLDGKNAIQTQSYGSESRGGACKSDVVISDEEIYELESPQVDVLVAMSQQAHEKYISGLRDGGTLIVDKDLVQIQAKDERRKTKAAVSIYAIPATDIAFKKFGRKIVSNMVSLGYMTALLEIVSQEGLKMAIKENVPAGTEDVNTQAFDEGYLLGRNELERASK